MKMAYTILKWNNSNYEKEKNAIQSGFSAPPLFQYLPIKLPNELLSLCKGRQSPPGWSNNQPLNTHILSS